MRLLTFKITRQHLVKNGDFSHIIAGSKGYLQAVFEFSEDWDDCLKVAQFYTRDDREYSVPIIDDACEVPDEVTESTIFRLRVLGKRGNDYRLQSNMTSIRQEVK